MEGSYEISGISYTIKPQLPETVGCREVRFLETLLPPNPLTTHTPSTLHHSGAGPRGLAVRWGLLKTPHPPALPGQHHAPHSASLHPAQLGHLQHRSAGGRQGLTPPALSPSARQKTRSEFSQDFIFSFFFFFKPRPLPAQAVPAWQSCSVGSRGVRGN